MKEKYSKEVKEAAVCIIISVIAAVAVFIFNDSDSFLKNGYEIQRGEYGDAEKDYELLVAADGMSEIPFEIKVKQRSYSIEEAEELIKEISEEIPAVICGENESLNSIKTDINLPKELSKYPGIKLKWYAENSELIGYGGQINNKRLSSPEDTVLKLNVSSGDIKREYIYDLRIYPAELKKEESIVLGLTEEIERLQDEQKYSENLILPKEINGLNLSYRVKKDNSSFMILMLGAAAAGLILLRPKEQKNRERKQREKELMLDYSDMVSKLLVYIGAGLTLRNAWFRITEVYNEGIKKGKEKHVCYEEMKLAADRIRQGIPEIKAYRDFARACRLRPYMRLCTILEQNIRNGDKMLKIALEMEMREAFNERKNTAKRLGEEMSTKLLIPLFISMIGVVLIVAVPALMKLS